MHLQLEALLLSSLVATAEVICSTASHSHSHSLHITLCNNGPIALPELLLHLSSSDPAVVAAGILPPPHPNDQANVDGSNTAGFLTAASDSLLQASSSA
jgi:hypothetical protein